MTTPSFKQILDDPTKFSDRAIADRMLITSTHNGKLDLNELASNIVIVAQRRAEFDPNYKDMVHDGQVSVYVSKFSTDYNLAAREMLGLIGPTWGEKLLHKIGKLDEPTHGLHCTTPKGVDFTNINNSLHANKVSCER